MDFDCSTPASFAKMAGVDASNFAKMLDGKQNITKQTLKKLAWYWARYSWANYAVDLDIPKDIISEALGHKHGSNVTGIYIKYILNKIDAANRQIIDYLQEK